MRSPTAWRRDRKLSICEIDYSFAKVPSSRYASLLARLSLQCSPQPSMKLGRQPYCCGRTSICQN